MSNITPERLRELIESHGRWLRCEPGGSHADLSHADLRDADLSDTDLSHADLSDTDLSHAVLSDAVLRGADLRGADLDKRYIQISCIGSRKGMTTYCFDDDWIWCGCFPKGTYKGGTLDEFEVEVHKTHANNPQFLAEYLGFIGYIRSLKEAATADKHGEVEN